MKKNVIVIVLLAIGLNSFLYGQSDTVYVIKSVDDMSKKTYHYSSRKFLVSDDDVKVGFAIDVHISNELKLEMITAEMVGIGHCNEKDEIIIMLENGETISIKSWLEFNCEGEAYFTLKESDLELLRKSPLLKIRMTNGYSHDSFTNYVNKKDRRYFIQLLYALDRGLVKKK